MAKHPVQLYLNSVTSVGRLFQILIILIVKVSSCFQSECPQESRSSLHAEVTCSYHFL